MPQKTGSRKKRSILAQAFFGVVILGCAVAAVFLYAERRIAPLLSGNFEGHYTSRIYSAPLRLRAKDPMSPSELRERLKRLSYARLDSLPAAPGQYQETKDGGRAVFTIFPRSFIHPFVRSTPSKLQLELSDSEVASIRLAGSGAPLMEAVLEPQILYEVSGPRRILRRPLDYAEIPPAMSDAIVAIEDKRFFRHKGVDLRAVVRAAWRDVRSLRKAQGGSTLTQQLARGLFLNQERTFSRKFKEAIIALYLEARLPKAEILRLYLDSVYLGQDGPVSILGLPAAAKVYLDKEPKDLTLAECALLAGVVNSPNRFNPLRNPDDALKRRAIVLDEMRQQGFIDEAAARAAAREPLRPAKSSRQKGGEADYFLAYVERHLEESSMEKDVLARGLTIFTTLDPLLQTAAQEAVRRARYQAALVALDPRTGAIRALVGGKDFLESAFDRATQAQRQPGSAFKPFVYGAALRASGPDNGRWTPASLIEDATSAFRIEGGTWSPRNYDRVYRGPVPMRYALSESLNAATANLIAKLGPESVIEYAKGLGITSPLKPEVGLALGTSEVNLLELSGAYCAFANGGFGVEPYTVEAILDAGGRVVEYHHPEPRSVMTPAESYVMTSLLRQVVETGTARVLQRSEPALARLAAGKTGTTDDGKDAWFIGYTPRLLAGVWTGADKPLVQLGLTGAGSALPIWASFMQKVPPSPSDFWPRPDGVTSVTIDPTSGLRAIAGCRERREEVFLSGTEPTKDCPLHAGGISGWLRRIFGPKPKTPGGGGQKWR